MYKVIVFLAMLTFGSISMANHNKQQTVCKLGSLEIGFTYPNPAGSSNFMQASSLELDYIKFNDKKVETNSLKAYQVFLRKFHGPNSYGNAISALFVNENAEVVLKLDSTVQTAQVGGSTGIHMGGALNEESGVCLLETGE